MLYLRKGKPLLVSNYVNLELDWYQGDTQTNYAQTNKPDWNYYDCLLYTSPSPRDQRGSRNAASA